MQRTLPLLQATNTLPVTPTQWLPFALIVIFTVVLVAALVYMLSSVINSNNAKTWARFQVYEGILSLVLLLVFSAFIYLFFLNPQTVYGQLKIVPTGCTGATQVFTLASCDVSQFNKGATSLAEYSFLLSYFPTAAQPFSLTYTPDPEDPTVSFSLEPPALWPQETAPILTYFYTTIMFTIIFNQIQLIMLGGAVLFLAVFISIGLIARSFGFLRTFGGAMIAFGLGLGIMYPLLTSLTYGFIDVNANVTCLQTIACTLAGGAGSFLSIILSSSSSSMTALLGTTVGTLISEVGYIIAGLTIVPVMNIVIVDAFIVDFSKAVGERMSFQQLFSNFI